MCGMLTECWLRHDFTVFCITGFMFHSSLDVLSQHTLVRKVTIIIYLLQYILFNKLHTQSKNLNQIHRLKCADSDWPPKICQSGSDLGALDVMHVG